MPGMNAVTFHFLGGVYPQLLPLQHFYKTDGAELFVAVALFTLLSGIKMRTYLSYVGRPA